MFDIQGVRQGSESNRKSPMLQWLRTSYATSSILALVFLVNNFLTGFFLSSSTLAQDPAINVHLSDFLVGVSGAVTLLLLRSRFSPQDDELYRYRQVALIWFVSSISATVIPLATERILSGQPLKEVRITGIPYGIESYFAQFALFTILIAGISEMRRASMNLAVARHKLQEIERNLGSQLKAQRTELEAQIASQIDPVLTELQTVVWELNHETEGGVEIAIPKLKSAIDDVVRPLSHSLALSSGDQGEFTQDSVATVVQLRKEISRMSLRDRWLSRISLGASFDPVLGPLVFAMFVMPSVGYLDSIASALLVCIPAVAAIAAVSLGLNRALLRIELPYVVVNVFGVITNGALTIFFVAATKLAPSAIPSQIVFGLSVGVGMLLSITGYFGLVIERRLRFLELANDANRSVASSLSRLRHEILVTQRQLGRLLHGGVQGRLQAAVLRLSRSEQVSEELVRDVTSDIVEARRLIERIDTPVSSSLGELLDDVIDFWAGVCEVTIDTTRELDELISRDAVAVQCVIELIREAVTNAVKHGQANDVSMKLRLESKQHIRIFVIHDEQDNHVLPVVDTGLGSHIYDELSNTWSLAKHGSQVVFEAEVGIKI